MNVTQSSAKFGENQASQMSGQVQRRQLLSSTHQGLIMEEHHPESIPSAQYTVFCNRWVSRHAFETGRRPSTGCFPQRWWMQPRGTPSSGSTFSTGRAATLSPTWTNISFSKPRWDRLTGKALNPQSRTPPRHHRTGNYVGSSGTSTVPTTTSTPTPTGDASGPTFSCPRRCAVRDRVL